MQMYQVSFQTHYENKIDMGKVLICAETAESASDLVIVAMELPRSKTKCESVRIKPSIYKLERREVHKPKGISVVNGGGDSPMRNYRCNASATIRATNEDHAMRRLATSIDERCASDKAMIPNYASSLVLDCEQIVDQGRMKRLESVELYKGKNLLGS